MLKRVKLDPTGLKLILQGGVRRSAFFIGHSRWCHPPMTTPSALWEAITLSSDYKTLMNTHGNTHTPWSLSLITLRQKRKKINISAGVFLKAADPAAAARPRSLILSARSHHATHRRAFTTWPPGESRPARRQAPRTGDKTEMKRKASVASRGHRRARNNPSWLTR